MANAATLGEEAQPDTGLGANSLEYLKAPKWMQESNVTGKPMWECGTLLRGQHLPKCQTHELSSARGWTNVLMQNPGNISDVVYQVVMLGENSTMQMQSCLVGNSAFNYADESVHNPVRVVVDNQYINYPSCCTGEERNGLVLNNDGENFPWTDEALDELENVTEFGLSFYRATPHAGVCTESTPCPLVIQIAGAAGNPWFLIQNHCNQCRKQLGVVVISPFLDKDMVADDGVPVGSSNTILTETMAPFMDKYLAAHPELDVNRVYLVAQSQGDDTALRLALLRPDVVSMVSLAAKNFISNQTKNMLRTPSILMKAQTSRLKSINWHVGDQDTAFTDEEYYPELRWQLKQFTPGYPRLELRIYPQSFHSVWWAAWNSLHEVVWTGVRDAAEVSAAVSTTCKGAHAVLLEDD